MNARQRIVGRKGLMVPTAAVVAAVVAVASSPGHEPSPPGVEATLPPTLIKEIGVADGRTRDRAVDEVLRQRAELVKSLIRQVDPEHGHEFTGQARASAAYLLGRLRAAEAVPALTAALGDTRMPENAKFVSYSDMRREDKAVWSALVEIGRPAVPAMIERIQSSDDLEVRRRALGVLYHVLGGKRRLLNVLDRLKDRTADVEAAHRFDAARTFAEGHYTEDVEPLF